MLRTSIHRRFAAITATLIVAITPNAATNTNSDVDVNPIRIYLDADRSIATTSGNAIEAGIQAAINQFGGEVHGRSIELVSKDHRGNIKRSKRSLEAFQNDTNALAIFCGMHSPPVLAHRDFINENQLLMLDPWAAAGPITRPDEAGENWIFRLSVDDANAGTFIANEAIARGIRKPTLFLEDTGWGKSNLRTMTEAVTSSLGSKPQVTWFNWGISEESMRILVRDAVIQGSDAIFFVGNAPEGAKLISAIASMPEAERLPVFSHWGITGGTLLQQVSMEFIQRVDLTFIQTKGILDGAQEGSLAHTAFQHATNKGLFEHVRSPRELVAPTGFIHAFDLTLILLNAIEQTDLTGDVTIDRNRIRESLEQLEQPVEGILRTYIKPFKPYAVPGSDAHEALGLEDYTLARYAQDGAIEHLPVMSDNTQASTETTVED